MTDLLAARAQMALSLAFHIVFACVGMAMPLLMVIAEVRWLRTRDPDALELARRWAKGTGILFAVGAVSGTVLSFELGLLWPGFMAHAGPVVGMPFSLEGLAFLLEAIFLGIYLYGWDRVPEKAHVAAGVLVLLSGTASGVLVVTANGWMNTPTGFDLVDGAFVNIDPWAAMANPAAFSEALHMTLAAFVAVGFAVAAVHAYALLQHRDNSMHRKALAIALSVGGVFAFLQPISGHISAGHVADYQPVKLAAMEGHWETRTAAPLRIGGWPDEETETTPYALEIPYGLSLLAHEDPHAEIMGLKDVPPEDRPPVAVVHIAFQIMVGCGFAMMGVALLALFLYLRRKRLPDQRWFLWTLVAAGPLGFIAIEAGWTVTEVGRQPWIVHGILRTADAVTPLRGLVAPFITFTALYIVLAVVVVILLRRYVFATITPGGPGDEGTHAGP